MNFVFDILLSHCDVCQCINRKLTSGTPQLNPIPVKSPWYMVGIDIVGPISPPADDSSQYILTIIDYFTKWAEAVPTVDKSAASTSTVLFKVYTECKLRPFIHVCLTNQPLFPPTQLFMRMGLPHVILSDMARSSTTTWISLLPPSLVSTGDWQHLTIHRFKSQKLAIKLPTKVLYIVQ